MNDDVTKSMAPVADSGAAAKRAPVLPETIGPYRVLALIGEGGMGAVYSAEQHQPRRVVALKVIRAGIAGPEMLRRFELEAQVLGRLHHPGIAQIYEAGTADTGFGPQPYFAMEFIQGQPLNRYVQEQQLSVRERLVLMAKICDGVQHAHQRGIIHRDLKPGNILVDESGQPKILDFGVARVTDSDAQVTRQTDMGQLVGTLAYMSPEQVLADPLEIDTRSDVYSLGVILYEMLSGQLPYNVRKRLLHEVVQTIREEEPRSLRTVNRVYRGDVETIVAKALEKDKTRRYASANGLAADLRRYLADEPIVARPATRAYQLQKFVRRNRALVVGVAAVFVVLAAGAVASTWQAIRARSAEAVAVEERARATAERDRAVGAEQSARAERDKAVAAEVRASAERDKALLAQLRADRESAVARSVNQFLQQDLLSQASSTAQADANRQADPDIKVRTVLDRAAAAIGNRFDSQPEVRANIEITIASAYEDMGLYTQALQHWQSALQLRTRLSGADSPEALKLRRQTGSVYWAMGKYPDARAMLEPVVARYGDSRSAEALLAMEALAMVYSFESKFDAAEVLYRKVLTAAESSRLVDAVVRERLLSGLAGLYFRQKKYDEAEPIVLRLVEAKRGRAGASHPTTLTALNNLGVLYQMQNRFDKALPVIEEVLRLQRSVLGENHAQTLNSLNNLGVVYVALGHDAKAEEIYRMSLDATRKALGNEHPRAGVVMQNLGQLLTAEGKYSEAEKMLSDLLAVRSRVLGAENPQTLIAAQSLGTAYMEDGKFDEAERLVVSTLQARRRVLKAEDPELAASLASLGRLRFRQGRFAEAETAAREAQTVLARKTETFDAKYAVALLGASLAAQGRFEAADQTLSAKGLDEIENAGAGTLQRRWIQEMTGKVSEFYARVGRATPTGERRARAVQ